MAKQTAELIKRFYSRDTRAHLSDVRLLMEAYQGIYNRTEQDTTLLLAERCGWLTLMSLDAPWELTEEREEAALYVLGEPRHIVYAHP